MSKAAKATVVVPTSWLEAGYFPSLCARTGEPCGDLRVKEMATRFNLISLVGLALGIWGFILLHIIFRHKAKGYLPFGHADRVRSRNHKTGLIVGGLSLIAISGLFTTDDALSVAGVIGVFGLLVALYWFFRDVKPGAELRLSKDKMSVTIKKVHPDFAAATQGLLAHVQMAQSVATDPTASSGAAGFGSPVEASFESYVDPRIPTPHPYQSSP